MEHSYSVVCKGIILRPLKMEESEKYRILRNMNQECFFDSRKISKEEQCAWYKRYLYDENCIMFSVYDKNEEFIGGSSIYNIDWKRKTAEYGRLVIDRNKAGNGYGCFATMGAIKIAFTYLDMRNLSLEVYKYNLAAVHAYKRAGFQITDSFMEKNGNGIYRMEKIRMDPYESSLE